MPYDGVLDWKDYDEYFGRHFHTSGSKENPIKPKYPWGHVVKEEFSPGVQGVREVKEVLSKIRGTLVEMPLDFLKNIDLAIEGVTLNAFTEEVYT